VVEKPLPPPLTGEQYGKMEPKYPEGGHCQSVLRPQGFLTSPFIFSNSVEKSVPFNNPGAVPFIDPGLFQYSTHLNSQGSIQFLMPL